MIQKVYAKFFVHLGLVMSTATLASRAEDSDPVFTALRAFDQKLEQTHYEERRVDLNGDGTEDALALSNGLSNYCGSGGCTLFVLRGKGERFHLVGQVRVVKPPVYLRENTNQGWRDLLARLRSTGPEESFGLIAHDGTSYPPSPDQEGNGKVLPTDKVLFEDPLPQDGHHAEVNVAEDGPAQLKPADLAEFEKLSPGRRHLVETALRIGREKNFNQYIFGSADPERGGFDCSGAMLHILKSCDLEPPRTSAGQYDWIVAADLLVPIPPEVTDLKDKSFSKLMPGDLLFWTGTYHPEDGRTNHITHVQMYLGTEKKDGRAVMIGSSDGRSYRGKRQCGYGVFDFRLPRAGSKAHFAGYGPPPGLKTEVE